MGHLVLAAKQLIDEVDEVAPKGEVTVADDVDGLGFNRVIRINAEATKVLGDTVVEALESDPRIEAVDRVNKGLRVTFVASTAADSSEPYGLAGALEQPEE